ncbi:autotransporter-associated beta strand protein [Luteibacter sp. Sphag1AF]|uniref:S8 family serine peptidase n=1 Tax=Luteibacter sp. Sphag1AF TaxID=2587031 RepID=UPI00160AB479|nr:S8 family serine peptidase [Luteibacter sp. Sphag1AF]MBB3228439.1 autotransporter-associated beta strand protein [Luteibacter sp. Sphag1AF]
MDFSLPMRASLYPGAALLVCLSLGACGGGSSARPGANNGGQAPASRYPMIPAGFTGTGVNVGLIDTGADSSHPALAGRIASQRRYLPDHLATPDKDDPYGHGTLMAQLIAGRGSPGVRGGVAQAARIHSARVADDAQGQLDVSAIVSAYQDLLGEGVRIFNNSYATTSAQGPAVRHAWYRRAFGPAVTQHRALLVFAAGNDGLAQPSEEARLPHSFPELERGWLAVVNVDLDAAGRVTGLHPASNACGSAAPWCIAAPGTHRVAAVGVRYASGVTNGTSAAAAIVTGAAALVQEAFPYFTGEQVRQTLLSTAAPLGDTARYGHGLLDIVRAVRGPAAFHWGEFDVRIPGDSTWSHDISGEGGVAKRGPGTLRLTGDNHYRGVTRVVEGSLHVDGTVRTPIHIWPAATLTGQGHILSDVINAGWLVTSARLRIQGNYQANDTAVLSVAPGQPLRVDGQALIEGSSLSLRPPAPGYLLSSSEPLLMAAHGVQGRFAQVRYEGGVFYDAQLEYLPDAVQAHIQRRSVAQILGASDTNGQMAALDAALTQASARAPHGEVPAEVAALLRSPDVASVRSSVDSLSASAHVANRVLAAQRHDAYLRAVALRSFSVAGGDVADGAWLDHVQWRERGLASSVHGSQGIRGGYDMRKDDAFAAGVAFEVARATAAFAGGNGTFTAATQTATLHAITTAKHGYIGSMFSLGNTTHQVQRTLFPGEHPATARSRYRVTSMTWRLEAGRHVQMGSSRLSPYLCAGIERSRHGAFTEHGASGFGIAASAQWTSRPVACAGLRYAARHQRVHALAHAQVQHNIGGRRRDFRASFAAFPDAGWRVNGPGLARREASAGVALHMELHGAWHARIGAEVHQRSGQPTGVDTSLGLAYTF